MRKMSNKKQASKRVRNEDFVPCNNCWPLKVIFTITRNMMFKKNVTIFCCWFWWLIIMMFLVHSQHEIVNNWRAVAIKSQQASPCSKKERRTTTQIDRDQQDAKGWNKETKKEEDKMRARQTFVIPRALWIQLINFHTITHCNQKRKDTDENWQTKDAGWADEKFKSREETNAKQCERSRRKRSWQTQQESSAKETPRSSVWKKKLRARKPGGKD